MKTTRLVGGLVVALLLTAGPTAHATLWVDAAASDGLADASAAAASEGPNGEPATPGWEGATQGYGRATASSSFGAPHASANVSTHPIGPELEGGVNGYAWTFIDAASGVFKGKAKGGGTHHEGSGSAGGGVLDVLRFPAANELGASVTLKLSLRSTTDIQTGAVEGPDAQARFSYVLSLTPFVPGDPGSEGLLLQASGQTYLQFHFTAQSSETRLPDGETDKFRGWGASIDGFDGAQVLYEFRDGPGTSQDFEFSLSGLTGDYLLSWSGAVEAYCNAPSPTCRAAVDAGHSAYLEITATQGGYTSLNGYGYLAAPPLPPVPEPATHAMWLAGLGVMGLLARRRRPG